jgi:sugar phosphate permease
MISEITAPNVRGRFLIIINFFVSVGKIYAFLLAYLFLEDFSKGHWRMMMCVSSCTSLIVGILALIFLMESPRYLMASGQVVEGLNIVELMIHKNHNIK